MTNRYQISFYGGYEIEPYFSRDYPQHEDDGYTFEEAKEEIIRDLESLIEYYKKQTEDTYFGPT